MAAFPYAVYDTNAAGAFSCVRFTRLTNLDSVSIGPDDTLGGMLATQIFGSDDAAQGVTHWGLHTEFAFRVIQQDASARTASLNGPDGVKWFSPTVGYLAMQAVLAFTGSGTVTFYHRKKIVRVNKDVDGNNIVSVDFVDRDSDTPLTIEAGLWADCSPLGDLAYECGGPMQSYRESKDQYNIWMAGRYSQDTIMAGDIHTADARGSLYPVFSYPPENNEGESDMNTEPFNIRPCVTTKVANQIRFDAAQIATDLKYNKEDFRWWINYALDRGYTAASQIGLNDDIDNALGDPADEKFPTNFGDVLGPLSQRYVTATFEEREALKRASIYRWLGILYTAATATELPLALRDDVKRFGLCLDEHNGDPGKPFYLTPGMPELIYTRGDRRAVTRRVMTFKDSWGTTGGININLGEIDSRDATVTMTAGSPGTVHDTAHGLNVGDKVKFNVSSGGSLYTGLTANVGVYVKTKLDSDSYTVSSTSGGTAINFTGSTSGTITRTTMPTVLREWPYTDWPGDTLYPLGYALDMHHGTNRVEPDSEGVWGDLGFPKTRPHPNGLDTMSWDGAAYAGIGLDNLRWAKGVCDNLYIVLAHGCDWLSWGYHRLDPGYASGGDAVGAAMAFCYLNGISPADLTIDMIRTWMHSIGTPLSPSDVEAMPSADPVLPPYTFP